MPLYSLKIWQILRHRVSCFVFSCFRVSRVVLRIRWHSVIGLSVFGSGDLRYFFLRESFGPFVMFAYGWSTSPNLWSMQTHQRLLASPFFLSRVFLLSQAGSTPPPVTHHKHSRTRKNAKKKKKKRSNGNHDMTTTTNNNRTNNDSNTKHQSTVIRAFCSGLLLFRWQVYDLAASDEERVSLNVREAADKGIFLEGLIEEEVSILFCFVLFFGVLRCSRFGGIYSQTRVSIRVKRFIEEEVSFMFFVLFFVCRPQVAAHACFCVPALTVGRVGIDAPYCAGLCLSLPALKSHRIFCSKTKR